MLKNRIFLLGVIALAVVGLYKLPRVVVDNREDSVTNTPSQEAPHLPGDDAQLSSSAHQIVIPDSSLKMIQNLRLQLESADNLEKSIIFADSLSKVYQRLGKFDSAAKYLAVIAVERPSPEINESAGNAHYEAFKLTLSATQRNYHADKARSYFEKVLSEDPSKLDLRVKIGMTYISGSNPMQGISMIRGVLEEDPGNREALFQLGLLSVSSGQFEKAVERFDQLVQLDPSNMEAVFYLGYSYLELGDKVRAKQMFQKVVDAETSPELTREAKTYLQNI